MPYIEIKGLSKSYRKGRGEVPVLKDLELAVERGESVAVLGASGVGKSTLLSLMGALDRPTEGEILYGGESIFKMDDAELARFRNRKVGFVFQFHHLLPEFTAVENVMLPGLIGGATRSELRAAAEDLLGEAGLSERLDHKPGELSGGEQQRVAIMRALVQSPEIILADEPTGNLDKKTGSEVFDIMMRLNAERDITLVVVTHNEDLASRMSRRVRMEDGRIVE